VIEDNAMKHLSHKIRIYPNNKAKSYLSRCFGTARFAYNWAINECKKSYDLGEKCPSGYDLKVAIGRGIP